MQRCDKTSQWAEITESRDSMEYSTIGFNGKRGLDTKATLKKGRVVNNAIGDIF